MINLFTIYSKIIQNIPKTTENIADNIKTLKNASKHPKLHFSNKNIQKFVTQCFLMFQNKSQPLLISSHTKKSSPQLFLSISFPFTNPFHNQRTIIFISLNVKKFILLIISPNHSRGNWTTRKKNLSVIQFSHRMQFLNLVLSRTLMSLRCNPFHPVAS